MKSAPFEYVRAKSLEHATEAVSDIGSAVIAGGQSLVPMLNLRLAIFDRIVDIGHLSELRKVSATDGLVHIGALVRHADIEDGGVPDLFDGLLPAVASEISYRSVRNRGTIGGSVALADPAADWPGCLMLLNAEVMVQNGTMTRSLPLDEFIVGGYSTALGLGEIIVGFNLPRPVQPFRWGVAKMARKRGAFANSIAFVSKEGHEAASALLAAAGPRPIALQSTATLLSDDDPAGKDAIKEAFANDIEAAGLQLDDYEIRMHCATVLRAIENMGNRSCKSR